MSIVTSQVDVYSINYVGLPTGSILVIGHCLFCCCRFGHRVEVVDSLNKLSVLNGNA